MQYSVRTNSEESQPPPQRQPIKLLQKKPRALVWQVSHQTLTGIDEVKTMLYACLGRMIETYNVLECQIPFGPPVSEDVAKHVNEKFTVDRPSETQTKF